MDLLKQPAMGKSYKLLPHVNEKSGGNFPGGGAKAGETLIAGACWQEIDRSCSARKISQIRRRSPTKRSLTEKIQRIKGVFSARKSGLGKMPLFEKWVAGGLALEDLTDC
ncbi:MAG: hypothetical protein ACJAVK_001917 [Akkermansiaceae bacterium]